jgi:radical SAM superfamily enzyme YgiQ (UPF0313 family)
LAGYETRIRDELRSVRSSEIRLFAIRKEALLRIALFFPNTYEVAASNLGFHSIYRLFNNDPRVCCERFVLPSGRRSNRSEKPSFFSIETLAPLRDFDVIAFTVSYEPDLLHVIDILLSAGIPPLSLERSARDPLVIAGGAALSINPEPFAPVVDIICIGDGEVLAPAFLEHALAEVPADRPRRRLLESFSPDDGFYVPALIPDGMQTAKKVKRATAVERDPSLSCSSFISARSAFHRMFLVELNRGCPHRCLFCVTPAVYGPLRFTSVDRILSLAESVRRHTSRIGLVGSAVADHPDVRHLCRELARREWEINISSLRAELCDSDLLELLRRGGTTTLTIAPESGSERLRKLVCKDIEDEAFLQTASMAGKAGFSHLRLYFLFGLPGETEEMCLKIAGFVRKIANRFTGAHSRRGEVAVTLTPFIPKPFTPLQWAPMANNAYIKKTGAHLFSLLRREKNVTFSMTGPREAGVQALLSRGNRNTALALYGERMKRMKMPAPFPGLGIERENILFREREKDEPFPWEIVDHGDTVKRATLWRRYRVMKKSWQGE